MKILVTNKIVYTALRVIMMLFAFEFFGWTGAILCFLLIRKKLGGFTMKKSSEIAETNRVPGIETRN